MSDHPLPPRPIRSFGPLFDSSRFKDTKDPCICFDGKLWHIYGSGGDTIPEDWMVLHATAPDIEGPWTEVEPLTLIGLSGPHMAAPSVIYENTDELYHMAVQRDFMDIGGGIEYFTSTDGQTFTWEETLIEPEGLAESGLYDPHYAEIGGERYLIYSGIPGSIPTDMPFTPQPDLYLARSMSGLWNGPYQRMGCVLDHDRIAWHHNRLGHPDYEWGIEGPQIIELPGGRILLNATCFLEEGRRGTRQRVFFALASHVDGPYTSLGPVLPERTNEWESGENGHASVILKGDKLYLFYQARSQTHPDMRRNPFRFGIAVFNVADFLDLPIE
ncbi:MAG: hypothetical protein ACM3TU_03425 [Bacillota bacterium]